LPYLFGINSFILADYAYHSRKKSIYAGANVVCFVAGLTYPHVPVQLKNFQSCDIRSVNKTVKRVVFFIVTLGMGGAERQLFLLTTRLKDHGWDPLVVTQTDGYWGDRLRAQRIPVINIRGLWKLSSLRSLPKLLRSPDLAVSWGPSLAGSAYTRLHGKRLPMLFVEQGDGRATLTRTDKPVLTLIRHHALAGANSQPALDRLLASGVFEPDWAGAVLENGIEIPDPQLSRWQSSLREELNIAPDAPVVGMIGNLREAKNLHMFLRVARRVHDAHPEAVFVQVGRGAPTDEEEKLLDSLPSGLVRFAGPRDNGAVLAGSFDVYTLTSRHEGLPNVILESMAWGIPVVATDVGQVPLVITNGENGYHVPVDDDEAMAAHVIRLLGDAEERRALGTEAKKLIQQRFGVDHMTEAAVSLFNRICAEHTG